ncbi:MAG: LysR family transcriptional regulator [Eubacteriales bacterium]|nr:LysR family transcriptional regulator [Eubacteriales bacterium]
MYISYDHYRIFYFVAKYGSFTKAADMLLSNQPNLTRTVRSLETSLGCTLFERSNKGVKLTDDGEKLYEHISIAFEHIEAGEREISQKNSLKKGVLSIGASEIALRCFLLPILNEYRHKYPGIQIKISNVCTPQAVTMLNNGLVDLAFVTTPIKSDPELKKINLKSLNETAICGEAFRNLINPEKPVSFRRITKYPIVSLGPKTSTFEFYLKLFLEHGCTFSSDIEAATADQIIPLVKHNLGIGFVPEDFIEANREETGIYVIPLKEEIPKRYISLIKRKGRTLSPPAKELERIITDNL